MTAAPSSSLHHATERATTLLKVVAPTTKPGQGAESPMRMAVNARDDKNGCNNYQMTVVFLEDQGYIAPVQLRGGNDTVLPNANSCRPNPLSSSIEHALFQRGDIGP
ncbi:hypothetical protein AJ80_01604 [Polytolypa hystricis UAMH7299]|uniref:Uncharacterized protein n=1 Tax=Polytolypa hystricis (strain UAMH7299) TaxID=1447883 RepID=A0A2B7Z0J9_POLH7|nr:hypothetical protein AJ80_01604 [Polytolypa hystricis UAMH7299]